MELQQLIAVFRQQSGDDGAPYLYSDEEVTGWLNDGERRAAIGAKLIEDRTNPDVVRVPLTVGQKVYTLHEAVFDNLSDVIFLERAGVTNRRPVARAKQDDIEWCHAHRPNQSGPAEGWVIHGDDTAGRRLMLDRGPGEVGNVLWLSVYRYPLTPMADDADEPEIHSRHHLHLVDWALFKAYNTRDMEGSAPGRADRHKALFVEHFGILEDANVQRKQLRHRATVCRPIDF